MKNKRQHTSITIPKILFEKIQKRIENTGFTSVSDYVTYVMREVTASLEEEEKKGQVFSKKEEEKVKQRLKALGYIK